MKRIVLTGIVAIAAAAATAAPTRARADDDSVSSPDRREANALYKEGVRLYNAGEYANALDLFRSAYRRYPAARAEFSLATTLKQMGRTVEAANWYQKFIDDPLAEPQFVSEARTLLTLIDTMVGRVDVSTDGTAAEIQLGDGEWQPARGALRMRVEPGTVVVRGRRPGFVAETTVKVDAGADAQVALRWTDAQPHPSDRPHAPTPKPLAPGTPAPAADPSPRPGASARDADLDADADADDATSRRRHARHLEAIASAGGGVVLAGAAVVLELGVRSRVAQAEAICPDLACDDRPGEPPYLTQATALTDAARHRYYAALGLGAAGAVAIAAGVALWITAPRESSVQVAPLAGDHTVGLVVAGHF